MAKHVFQAIVLWLTFASMMVKKNMAECPDSAHLGFILKFYKDAGHHTVMDENGNLLPMDVNEDVAEALDILFDRPTKMTNEIMDLLLKLVAKPIRSNCTLEVFN